ncbi:MAG TPA: hypothetical protein VFL34_07880 [Candidatus Sulfotelmatobacter sp.]|nr:hypothetical protein [Candidatus Sulfotelmatobacter sp.]
MRLAAFFLLLFLVSNAPLEPAIPYFTNVREVRTAQPQRQNFFVVDAELWARSRSDLGDLRLYDGESPVQYQLSEQRDGTSSEEVDAKILNLGSVSGHTEFDLDTQGLAEYDRIRLRLDAHDFVVTASVSGGGAPGKAAEVELTPTTLYDFTKEQLGSNWQLKLPPSSFRYLHVRLSGGILPQQVKGASIANLREQQASWIKAGSCAAPQAKQRTTEIACEILPKVPLNLIQLQVEPAQVNFRRIVSMEDARSIRVASGEISRVRVNRAGTLVTHEDLAVKVNSFNVADLNTGGSGHVVLTIDNADNPPLNILAAEPLSLERRVYFDPQGKSMLQLYYGDDKLSAPVYDYAHFFHLDLSSTEAQLGPGGHNPQYTGRPDDRPWSERHTSILWGAMILAVLALSVLALRGLRTEPR